MYKTKPHLVTAALDDVLYEITCLVCATDVAYAAGKETPFSLETRLLHTRALIDFFQDKKENRKKDDVLAEDYNFPPRCVKVSNELKTRLNKQLNHITYKRVDLKRQGKWKWPVKDTLLPLLDLCEEFLQHLIDHSPADISPEQTENARKRVNDIGALKRKIANCPEPKHGI